MNNLEIREAIKKSRLFHYEIAEALGISEPMFSKWLRTELDGEKKKMVLQAIRDLKMVQES